MYLHDVQITHYNQHKKFELELTLLVQCFTKYRVCLSCWILYNLESFLFKNVALLFQKNFKRQQTNNIMAYLVESNIKSAIVATRPPGQ